MDLDFTGEQYVPGRTPERIEKDHLERYLFSRSYVKNRTVLDIACGVGYGSSILAKAGATEVTGVDISDKAIGYAERHYSQGNLLFLQGDIATWKSGKRFDVITCFETIEHVDNHEGALLNISSLLREDGILIISSPNRLLTSPAAKRLGDRPDNRFHVREFAIHELMDAVASAGFQVDA